MNPLGQVEVKNSNIIQGYKLDHTIRWRQESYNVFRRKCDSAQNPIWEASRTSAHYYNNNRVSVCMVSSWQLHLF